MDSQAKIFEENARIAKLSIDKQLLAQILQEMDRTHDDAVKELEEKLQEENRAHDDATKELREKMVELEEQIKLSSRVESIPSEMPEPRQEMSEPAQEMSESPQEISTEDDTSQRAREMQERVRALLQESKGSESEVPPETSKKRKRTFF